MKLIVMKVRVCKFFILLFLIFFLVSCQSTTSKSFVYGTNFKLWLLFDTTITDSGNTPFILCFDDKKYNCYIYQNTGLLHKRISDDIKYQLIEGGEWKLENDSFYFNNIVINQNNINHDTIQIMKGIYLLNITNKFNSENCDCSNLKSQFKGGSIDSIKTLLNYKE
jgi:hypothetical protein